LFDNNIDLASMNAAESVATAARTATALVPPGGGPADPTPVQIIMFCIGLANTPDSFPDQFLHHIANDTSSDLFVAAPAQLTGTSITVTGPGQLGAAFQQIASFVLRLSS
jgi:hypothetical protein